MKTIGTWLTVLFVLAVMAMGEGLIFTALWNYVLVPIFKKSLDLPTINVLQGALVMLSKAVLTYKAEFGKQS
jgi:hypothetical protein